MVLSVSSGNVIHGVTVPRMSHDRGPYLNFPLPDDPPRLGRSVVDGVVRTAGEFEDVIGDLDGEAVVQVSGKHEDSFIQSVPMFYKFLPFLKKYGPCIVFFDGCLLVVSSSVPRVEP